MHYVFNPDHYIGIVIANTTLLYKYVTIYFFTGQSITTKSDSHDIAEQTMVRINNNNNENNNNNNNKQ